MTSSRWETKKIICSEQNREATLLIEWLREADGEVVKSICCDNPDLHHYDNWECQWSCWQKIGVDKK